MPYIDKSLRANGDKIPLDRLGAYCIHTGELTYVFYKIGLDYFRKDPCYQNISDIRGALMGALHELDRRHFDKYEDQKIKDNGDI